MRSRVVDLGYVAINSMEITRGLFYPPTVLADVPTSAPLGGAAASIEAFTETRGVTLRSKAATYPFLTSSEMRHAALLSGARPTRANRSMADNGGVHHRSPPYWSIVCNYLEVKSRVR